ncbi:MAG: hypothetical protein IIA87_01525 [Nanoarchaeota archaeon]|nr:hypothetical protein [Nanoarchaeota archaeon]
MIYKFSPRNSISIIEYQKVLAFHLGLKAEVCFGLLDARKFLSGGIFCTENCNCQQFSCAQGFFLQNP